MSWTLIEHQALSSSAASVTLGSGGTIPQTYKTLKLVISVRTNGTGGQAVILRPNSNANNQSFRSLEGNGATVSSYSNGGATTNQLYVCTTNGTGQTSNTFASSTVDIPNYTGSANKPISADYVTENNATTAYQTLFAGLWSDSSAITSLYLYSSSGDFVSGCTFTLYGLA